MRRIAIMIVLWVLLVVTGYSSYRHMASCPARLGWHEREVLIAECERGMRR